jgi:hypothetical protein
VSDTTELDIVPFGDRPDSAVVKPSESLVRYSSRVETRDFLPVPPQSERLTASQVGIDVSIPVFVMAARAYRLTLLRGPLADMPCIILCVPKSSVYLAHRGEVLYSTVAHSCGVDLPLPPSHHHGGDGETQIA